MKRVLAVCALFVFALAVAAWPGAEVLAQNAGRPSRTPQSLPDPTKNVYELVDSNKSLGKFAELIADADLKGLFTGAPSQPITVFAPNDDALGDVPHDVMKRIKANKASLQSFVKYHVITGSRVGSSAIKGRKASPASANGEALTFDGTDKSGSPKVGDAALVGNDIPATNGVIHVVSGALVPPSLLAEPVAPVATPVTPVAPVVPNAPVATTPAAPVAPTAAASTATSGSTPMEPTTTPAMPPAETTTGAVPEIPPDRQQPVPPPSQPDASQQQPAGDTGKGFSLFGHKFGW